MARDIFQREVDLGTPLAADATRLLVSELGNEDMLIQNVEIRYEQNINRIWEVGSPKVFFIAGRTAGTMQVARIIGGKGVQGDFIRNYGDVCKMRDKHLTLLLQAGCDSPQSKGKITASGVVITSVAYSVAAADMIINEAVSLMFARLENVS